MLSCPFLRKLTSTTINRDVQQLINFVPKCPIAGNVLDESLLNHAKTYCTAADSVETPSCKDVSDCLFKKCPYDGLISNNKNLETFKSDAADSNNICNSTVHSLRDIKTLNIPRGCALFAGWKSMNYKTNYNGSPTQSKTISADESMNVFQTDSGFDYNKFFSSEIQVKKSDSTYRVFRKVLRDATQFPYADDFSTGVRRRVAVWCSNDYLGMSWHPKVQEAAITTIRKHGVGSGGTRNISGNSILHEALETELADLHGKPAALVFTSCYVANEAILHTLGTRIPDLTILSDAGNHASMIHGIRTSRCSKLIYKHNNVQHLTELLGKLPKHLPKLVAFETVHSMSGDVCPLKQLLDVTQSNNALSFVDEVHAVGLYGEHGAGVAERDRQMHRIDAITGTLGKAFASVGGYLVGSTELVDMIRSYASGFIFTTSLPPHTLAASRASIQILKSDEGRQLRQAHQKQVALIRRLLQNENLPVIDTPSHIVPLHIGEAKLCTKIMEELLTEHNIYVQAINYPTVDRGDERLRIAPTPHHTDEMAERLVSALCAVWRKYNLSFLKKSVQQML